MTKQRYQDALCSIGAQWKCQTCIDARVTFSLCNMFLILHYITLVSCSIAIQHLTTWQKQTFASRSVFSRYAACSATRLASSARCWASCSSRRSRSASRILCSRSRAALWDLSSSVQQPHNSSTAVQFAKEEKFQNGGKVDLVLRARKGAPTSTTE